jgi:MoxR-like ATPase
MPRRRKDAPKASDVISMLEKMGGVAPEPKVVVHKVTKGSPLPGTVVLGVDPGIGKDFYSILGGKTGPGIPGEGMISGGPILPPLIDAASVLAAKHLPDNIAVKLADLLDTVKSDQLTYDDLNDLDLSVPDGFASIVEVITHPTFAETCQEHYDCVWVGLEDRVQRFREVMPKAKVIDVPRDISADDADPSFYLKPEWYDDLKALIDRGEPVLIIGPAGVGKTEAVEQIFKERDQRLEIVSCTPRTTANDLEGATDLVVEEGHQITKFTPAAPAIASAEGYGLLLDEADAAPSEAMYSMYRLLDNKPMHVVRKGYDGQIDLDKEFRVIGTQNTEGRGDDRGLYHGRAYQDEAFLDRWRNTVRVTYPTEEQEILILRKRTGITGPEGEDIVKSAKALRGALEQDEIMLTCTLRRTLAVASNLAAGMIPQKAWDYAVVNRATPEDGAKIMTILQRIYGSKLKAKRKRKKKAKA